MIVSKKQKSIITKNRARVDFKNNGNVVILYGAQTRTQPTPPEPDLDFTNEPYYTLYFTPDSPSSFIEKNGNYCLSVNVLGTGKYQFNFKTDFPRENIMVFGNPTGTYNNTLLNRAILSIHNMEDFLTYTTNSFTVIIKDIGLYSAIAPFKIAFVNAGGF